MELNFVGFWKKLKSLSHDLLAHLILGQELRLDDLAISFPILFFVANTTLGDGIIAFILTSLASGRRNEVKELDKITWVKSITLSISIGSVSLLDLGKTSLFEGLLQLTFSFLFFLCSISEEVVIHECCADNQSARGDS